MARWSSKRLDSLCVQRVCGEEVGPAGTGACHEAVLRRCSFPPGVVIDLGVVVLEDADAAGVDLGVNVGAGVQSI